MPVSTRIQPLSQALDIVVQDTLSPAARSRAVAGFARETLREAQAQNRRTLKREPAYRQFVDGAEGKPLEQVRADGGRIVFEFDIAEDITTAIMAMLVDLSPVDTGDYRQSHFLFADGRMVLKGEAAPPAEEYTFLNLMEYSRAIELGRMKMRVEGTSRVYQQAARIAQGRFGNLASIDFTYRSPRGSATSGKAGRAARTPAIVVTMR